MKFNYLVLVVVLLIMLSGCLPPFLTVRQVDLNAWVNVPVEALDMHPVFLTMRLETTFTEGGLEIRNYVNERNVSFCPASGVCAQKNVACNNIFYIKEGIAQEYRPTPSGGARCYTDKSLQPRY